MLNIQIVDEFRPSRLQRTLERLVKGLQQPEYFFNHKLPAGYITIGHVANELYGGSQGARRIRDLRARGFDIDGRRYGKDAWGKDLIGPDGKRVWTWIYRINTPVDRIDFQNCVVIERRKHPRYATGAQLSVSL